MSSGAAKWLLRLLRGRWHHNLKMTTMGAKFASSVEWRSLLTQLPTPGPPPPPRRAPSCLESRDQVPGHRWALLCHCRPGDSHYYLLWKEKFSRKLDSRKKKKVQMLFSGAVASSVEKIVNRWNSIGDNALVILLECICYTLCLRTVFFFHAHLAFGPVEASVV